MPMIAMGAGVGVSALGSIIGGIQAGKESAAARAQAADFTNKAIAALEKVGIPSVEAQKIALENPKMVFDYAPEMEKEFPELKSKFDQIQTDPRLQAAQSEALAGIQERATGGLTADEKAQIDSLRRGTAQQANARDASILQNMEQRGMGSSGAELLSRLASSQAAAQQASIDTENQASLIAQRKLEALQQLGSLAGQQQSQQFSQEAQKASALDEIARLNQAAKYNIQSSNVGAQRQAQLSAAEMKQQLENQRAATANQQQTYNKELLQQKFQNEMNKAGSTASAYTGAGNQALQGGAISAANKLGMWQGVGNAAMGGAQLYGATQKKVGTTKPVTNTTSTLNDTGYNPN